MTISLRPMKRGDKTVYRNTANPVIAEFAEFSDADNSTDGETWLNDSFGESNDSGEGSPAMIS